MYIQVATSSYNTKLYIVRIHKLEERNRNIVFFPSDNIDIIITKLLCISQERLSTLCLPQTIAIIYVVRIKFCYVCMHSLYHCMAPTYVSEYVVYTDTQS